MSENQPVKTEQLATFQMAVERTAVVAKFMRERMIEGIDYGVIPGSTKPTLLKPGAQKLMAAFNLASVVKNVKSVIRPEQNLVIYEVTVGLTNKLSGMPEAEGVGQCNSQERKYVNNRNAAELANTILKMAKKRGLVDAVIDATGASTIFTQDLEDMDTSDEAPRGQSRQSAPRQHTQQSTQRPPQSNNAPGNNAARQNDNYLSDAQHRAILGIAGRVFGRPATAEDFATLTQKPIEELTKGEASALIDRLRFRLAEQQGGVQNQGNYNRSAQYARNGR